MLVVATLAARRRTLQRYGGTVDCSLRVPGDLPWSLGIGRYDGDSLKWYRIFSLDMRPRRVLSRNHLTVVDRRRPGQNEANALLPDAVVISCREDGASVELALSEPAMTGFLAWLEASPPGAQAHYG